jgi:hypothetical protein
MTINKTLVELEQAHSVKIRSWIQIQSRARIRAGHHVPGESGRLRSSLPKCSLCVALVIFEDAKKARNCVQRASEPNPVEEWTLVVDSTKFSLHTMYALHPRRLLGSAEERMENR